MSGRKKDYEVGYKKPPVASRFQKGKSGNPRGRAPGHRNLKTDLREELDRKIKVTENGRTMMLTIQQAMVKRLALRAVGGDAKAIMALVDLRLRLLGDEEATEPIEELSEADQALLDAYVARARRADNE